MIRQRIHELEMWKKRPFCTFMFLFSIMALFCIVRIAMPCREYQYEGGYSFVPGASTNNVAVYDGISLAPGVYRIELEYESDTDLAALCNVMDGTVFAGGLLSNGEHMYGGLDKTGYDMWLFEGTDDLQVVVSYGGNGYLATGDLRIAETNLLWTMLLAGTIFVGAVVGSAMVFYYYDKRFRVSRDKKNVFFWVMAISLIASVPYLCGYNITGADLTYHLQRIEGVKDGLLGGQFPVRLEPKWVYGHGYADAVFYCNTFLYFPALLRLLGFPVSASYNAYCIVLNIATAWISYLCFSRIFGKRSIGIICSALYTLSIFRIYKLIITSAVGEGTAVTFLPLVIYGLYRIFTENPEDKRYKTAWMPIMFGLSGLIQSHVLTCEVTCLVILFFCIVFIRKVLRWHTFLELLKGAVASLLLSLWFLVPFADYYLTQDVHIKHVSARTIQDRGLYLAQLAFHFWTTGINALGGDSGMQYSHPVGIGLILIAALGLFLILWFSGAFRKADRDRMPFVKAAAVLGLLLLYMSMSVFPWDRIQSINSVTAALVSSLQFPNRFLGWGTVCLALVFGFLLRYFLSASPISGSAAVDESQGKQLFYWALVLAAVIGVVTSGMYLLDFVNRDGPYFKLYNEESMGFGYISGKEYIIQGTETEKLTFAKEKAGEGVEILDYKKEYLKVELECVNTASTDSYVDLPLLLYKGYKAVCVDTGQEMQICAGENNVVRVLIPAGFAGNLKVSFVSPVYWRISELINVLFVCCLVVIGWKHRRIKGSAAR